MLAGDKIGHYRIIKELGRGLVSIVFLVEDNNQQKYALKILQSFSTQKHVSLLKREALIFKRLYHPNIVKITGYEYFDPYHCLVMEYANGSNLGEMLEKKKWLSLKDTIQISWQVSRALEYAHFVGIVHRDIKPQNIIIGKNNAVKITDFGLASAATVSIASLPVNVSTPYYISPELARGEKGDERTDLYSLGVVMYQMIAGKVPFHAENIEVVLDMHRNKKPEEISSIRKKVPQDLVWLVNKALTKSPKERFQSAREMSRSIQRIADKNKIPLEEVKVPVVRNLVKIFFYWPWVRVDDLITNLGANVVWIILTSVVMISISIFGLNDLPNQALALFQTTETPTTTLTPPPTFTISPTHTITVVPLTLTLTATPLPPTLTNTPRNTATSTSTRKPTKTPTHTPTITAIPPSPPPLLPTATNTPVPLPTNTPLPINTSPNSILTVGEEWHTEGRELLLNNYTFETTRLHFDIRFTNKTENPIIFDISTETFVITDNLGRRYTASYPLGCGTGGAYELTLTLQSGATKDCNVYFNSVDYANLQVNQLIFSATASVFQNAQWQIPIQH